MISLFFTSSLFTQVASNRNRIHNDDVKSISEYTLLLEKAMNTQLACDSLHHLISIRRMDLSSTDGVDERKLISQEIDNLKVKLKTYQSEADALFNKVNVAKSKHTEILNINSPETYTSIIFLKKQIGDLKIYAFNQEPKVYSATPVLPLNQERKQTNSGNFEILSNSVYSKENPIPDTVINFDGLIYRIQLGVFSKNILPQKFGGLSPLTLEEIEGKELTKYYVGYFFSSRQVRQALGQVKEYGFSDAFILAYYNKSKISINEAREIEFGQKK